MQGVGIFNVCYRIAAPVGIIQMSFRNILEPMVARAHGEADLPGMQHLYQNVTKWTLSIVCPAILAMVAFSDFILSLFGEGFLSSGVLCLYVLAGGFLTSACFNPAASVLAMTGYTRVMMYNNIAALAFSIICNWILVPLFGAVGAAIATALTMLLLNALRILEVVYLLRIHPFRPDLIKPLIAGFVALLPVLVLKTVSCLWYFQILMLFLYFLLYCGLIYLLRLSDEDKYVLQHFLDRVRTLKEDKSRAPA
jgi:O-antigen/teichoic acid export membrane protein